MKNRSAIEVTSIILAAGLALGLLILIMFAGIEAAQDDERGFADSLDQIDHIISLLAGVLVGILTGSALASSNVGTPPPEGEQVGYQSSQPTDEPESFAHQKAYPDEAT